MSIVQMPAVLCAIASYLTIDIFVAHCAYEIAAVILISKLAKGAVKQDCVEQTERKKNIL